MDIKDIAKSIRTVLKSTFPATKFSVTISRFSQGSSADVSWTDGPTKTQVNDLIGEYGTRSQFINTDRVHTVKLANKAEAVEASTPQPESQPSQPDALEVLTETVSRSQSSVNIKALEGKKATLMIVNTIGCPALRHIKIVEANIVPAKRYQGHMTDKKCLELKYIQKGKRKTVGTRYTEATLALALGWQEIKVPNEFISFDSGLLNIMTRQAKDVIYTQQDL